MCLWAAQTHMYALFSPLIFVLSYVCFHMSVPCVCTLMFAFIYVHSYSCSPMYILLCAFICALICVLLLCSHVCGLLCVLLGALICVFLYVCSYECSHMGGLIDICFDMCALIKVFSHVYACSCVFSYICSISSYLWIFSPIVYFCPATFWFFFTGFNLEGI